MRLRQVALLALATAASCEERALEPTSSSAREELAVGPATPVEAAVLDAPEPAYDAAAASNGSQHVVVWCRPSTQSGPLGLVAGFVDGDGKPVGKSTLLLDALGRTPSVAWDGAHFAIAWLTSAKPSDRYDVALQHLSATGVLTQPKATLVGDSAIGGRLSLASNGTQTLVLWARDDGNGTYSQRAARVDANGNVLDPGGLVVASGYGPGTAAWDGTQWVVAWRDQGSSIRLARLSSNGVLIDANGIVAGTPEGYGDVGGPAVAVAGGVGLVGWTQMNVGGEGGWVATGGRARRFGSTLAPLDTTPIKLPSKTLHDVSGMGEEFWLALDDGVVRMGSNGVVGETLAQNSSIGCALAATGGTSALCVTSGSESAVRAAKVTNQTGQDLDALAHDVSLRANGQTEPALGASFAAGALVVWRDDRQGAPGFRGRVLDTQGVASDPESKLIADVTVPYQVASVARAGDDWFLAWGNGPYDQHSIEARFLTGSDVIHVADPYTSVSPAAACFGKVCLVAWTSGFQVEATRVGPSGLLDSSPSLLASYLGKPETWTVQVLPMQGRFVLIWRFGSAVIDQSGNVVSAWPMGGGVPYWYFDSATNGEVGLAAWTQVPDTAGTDPNAESPTFAMLLGPNGEQRKLAVQLDVAKGVPLGEKPAVAWDGERFLVAVQGRLYRITADGDVLGAPSYTQLEELEGARLAGLSNLLAIYLGTKLDPTLGVPRLFMQTLTREVGDYPLGAPCAGETECASKTCSQGVCCDRSCDEGEVCDSPGQLGHCFPASEDAGASDGAMGPTGGSPSTPRLVPSGGCALAGPPRGDRALASLALLLAAMTVARRRRARPTFLSSRSAGASAILLASLLVAGSCSPAEEASPATDAGNDATDSSADAEEGSDTDAGNPFAHCAEPVPSSCSLEATCTALKCGEPLSPLDSTGCLRAKCKADADCSAGMRCISTTLVAVGCVSPQLYSCSPDGDTCHCTGMVDCLGLVHCVAVADAPPEQDCQLTGNENCSALLDEKDAIERQLDMMGLGPDLAGKLQACLQKLSAAATANGC